MSIKDLLPKIANCIDVGDGLICEQNRLEPLSCEMEGKKGILGERNNAEEPRFGVRNKTHILCLKIVPNNIGHARIVRSPKEEASVARVREIRRRAVFEIKKHLVRLVAVQKFFGFHPDQELLSADFHEGSRHIFSVGRDIDIEQVLSVFE